MEFNRIDIFFSFEYNVYYFFFLMVLLKFLIFDFDDFVGVMD